MSDEEEYCDEVVFLTECQTLVLGLILGFFICLKKLSCRGPPFINWKFKNQIDRRKENG